MFKIVKNPLSHIIISFLLLDYITLQLPRHNIPAKPTTYFCQLRELPADKPYHVLAAEPIIKSDAVHHIDVYGCTDAGRDTCNLFMSN